MRILITGAGGHVGTDLIPLLLSRGHHPAGFDLMDAPAGISSGVPWIKGDVAVREEVFDAVKVAKPDSIWHLAAILSATGERAPFRAWRVNMEGTRAVLEAARVLGVPQVLFTSTIAANHPPTRNAPASVRRPSAIAPPIAVSSSRRTLKNSPRKSRSRRRHRSPCS